MDIAPSPNAYTRTPSALLMFGPFALDRASQRLLKGGKAVRLGSRAFGLLVDLVESAGQLRTRAQLEARVWPRSIVEETSLRVHMSALRRALGDGRDGARYISNVPGCGYSFVATVTSLDGAAPVGPAPACHARESPQQTQLFGRVQALEFLHAQLAHLRLLSIVGAGGVGKTALALAVAAQQEERFAGSIVHVELAGVNALPGVVAAVAEAAALPPPAGELLAALCAQLAQGRRLLVLDHCDQAIESTAAVAIALLHHCPGIHILATSRERLDVQGETVYWLDGLVTPATALADPDQAMAYAAVRLFAERAGASGGGFVLDGGNVGDVCRLCRHLDGIPLAIELAAARVGVLGVAGLTADPGALPGLLIRARRTALPRHRSMNAALAWSFDRLSDDEQMVLCRSAVFQAEFSIDAARAVCIGAGIDSDTAARCIESLAAKSLLVCRMAGNAALYRQLLLTRSYVWEKLDACQKAQLARRHANHVADLLAASVSATATVLPWLAAHGHSFDDCRAAVDWAFSAHGDGELGVAMTPNLIRTMRLLGTPDDFHRSVRFALDALDARERRGGRNAPAPAPEAALSACTALAILGAYSHTDSTLLRDILARMHALLAVVDSPVLRIEALVSMGAAAFALSEPNLILEIARKLRLSPGHEIDPDHVLMADRLELGGRHLLGEFDCTETLGHRVLRAPSPSHIFKVPCTAPGAIGARWYLARTAWISGKPELAAQFAHEALAYAGRQHVLSQCQTLVIVALPVALWRGDDDHAAQLLMRLEELAVACRSQYWTEWAVAFRAAATRRGAGGGGGDGVGCAEALAPIAHDTLATLDAGLVDPSTLARAAAGSIGWCAAEVLRAHGERLLRRDGENSIADADEAESLFLRALVLARRQRALGWELRIARSLWRCWRGGPRAEEGGALLAEVLGRFSEGLDTADCRAATCELAGR